MGYLCATCGGVGGLFEASHAHSDKDSCVAELKAEKAKLLLQVDQMRDVVDAACAYESILGLDDLNSAYQSRREVTDAFVKAVGAYKTRLPEKRKDEPLKDIQLREWKPDVLGDAY